MKTLIAGLLLIAQVASAQAPAVYLQVKRLSTDKDTQHNWETDWGSYDRDYSRSIGISISMRNMQKDEVTITLEWFFIAKNLATKRQWIFDHGGEGFTLNQNKPLKMTKVSSPLQASVQNYATMGVKQKAGSSLDGFIVRVRLGDKVLAAAGSSNPLEQIALKNLNLEDVLRETNDNMN